MNGRERLFFALWPDEALRKQLVKQARGGLRSCGGRPISPPNIHLTLVFLGSVDGQQRNCLENLVESIRVEAFGFELQRWEYWRRSRVVGCRPKETPEGLIELVARLRAVTGECGIDVESRPFKPHVTLVRKAQREPKAPMPEFLYWPATEFVLVRSRTLPEGASYETVGAWKLR